MTNMPTLDEVLDQLKQIADVDDIDPDRPVIELEEVDSLDLMEWLYSAREDYGLEVDEAIFDDLQETSTLRDVYSMISGSAEAAAAGA
jgi:acyl carrier protein